MDSVFPFEVKIYPMIVFPKCCMILPARSALILGCSGVVMLCISHLYQTQFLNVDLVWDLIRWQWRKWKFSEDGNCAQPRVWGGKWYPHDALEEDQRGTYKETKMEMRIQMATEKDWCLCGTRNAREVARLLHKIPKGGKQTALLKGVPKKA